MFSLDPITEGGYGYPLLFQTGETWHGQPLHDRQHPHDLVDELAASYSRLIGGGQVGLPLPRLPRRAGARPADLHAPPAGL